MCLTAVSYVNVVRETRPRRPVREVSDSDGKRAHHFRQWRAERNGACPESYAPFRRFRQIQGGWMSNRVFWPLLVPVLLSGCQRGRVITDKPFKLGSSPVRISMTASRSSGPTRQVCLSMSREDADSLEAAYIRAARRRLPLQVVLLSAGAVPDTLGGTFGAALLLKRDSTTICVLDQGGGRPAKHPFGVSATTSAAESQSGSDDYTALELSSNRPVVISEVRYWSGTKFLLP